VLALEAAVSRNESVIVDLNYIIKEKESALQSKSDELQKKSQELSQHKTKSASEVSNFCSANWVVGNTRIICSGVSQALQCKHCIAGVRGIYNLKEKDIGCHLQRDGRSFHTKM
jgi:hypothetical protein